MDAFILLILFSSTLLLTEASEPNCPMMQCGHGTPKIQFPFKVKGLQYQHSVHPSFELVCSDNTTIIHFPSYGDLVVKSISYDAKTLDLLDPKICVHEVFLNLDLSLTPFHYRYVVKNYTYLNCSSSLSSSFTEVPCLSGSGHHIYTVEPSLALPNSCSPVKTVAIPFQYSPYLADNSFGLGLSWDQPGSKDSEAKGGHCELDKVSSISIFFFAMAVMTVAIVKIYQSKKLHPQDEEKYPKEAGKSFGEYQGIKADSDTEQV